MNEARRNACACVALAAALPGFHVASAGQPLTLAAAEPVALQEDHGVVVLLEQAEAFEQLAVAASALPDPQLRFGAANLPVEGGGFRTEGMTHVQLGLRQAFPPAAGRAAAMQRHRTDAEQRRAQAEARRRTVLLALRSAWLDAVLQADRQRLVLDSRDLFENLVAVTRSLYALGRKNQQDLLRAELELSQLQARLVTIEQARAVAVATLGGWLGAEARRPLEAALPEWSEPPSLSALRTAVGEHPRLLAAAAEVAATEAAVALAHARFRPNWTVDAAYGYRDGALPDGSSRSDFFSVTATMSVPLFPNNRQDRRLRAAQRQRSAAVAARDDLRRLLRADLEREHGRWTHLGDQLALYGSAVLPQARATADSALAAYRSEAAAFADVMRSYINDLEVRLDHVRLRIERRRSHVQLAYLGGFAL